MHKYRYCLSRSQVNKLITNIRDSVNRGMAIGSEQFKREIELLTGRRMQPKKRGRPLGWKKDEV
ncbi:hypothetical protein ACMAZF_05210 [Psychrobium sp. nBUS_13]|uniref:hypothetical protein n=1 Tax=Psychrobium sp. nBUS_13 TaxID=3395319 RepID=UPI003EBB9C33